MTALATGAGAGPLAGVTTRALRAGAGLLAAAALLAGCASASAASPASGVTSPPLATSLLTPGGTWAAVVMGGSAANHNNFWQLFTRPAGATSWRLVTPPGVASNGGLVLTDTGGQSVMAGFRPSQALTFSPLATSTDDGASWSPGLLTGGLAASPDALAADPASGQRLAVLTSGEAELGGQAGGSWRKLITGRALAATPAGRRCAPRAITAGTFTAAGEPMLAGDCATPGTTGIFSRAGTDWRAAGPVLPASYGHQPITVLRLYTGDGLTTALLAAGTGRSMSLLAAWSRDGGAHWTLSPPLTTAGQPVTSASPGAGGTIAVLSGGHAEDISPTAAAWRRMPPLPPRTAVLAPAPAMGWQALAVQGARLTIWQTAPDGHGWDSAQIIHVPIQYGSSS